VTKAVKYFTKTELKLRGWTDLLIRKLLVEPDEMRRHCNHPSWPPMQLYVQSRVKRKEKTKAFQKVQVARETRRSNAAKRREQEKANPPDILVALFTLNRRAKRCRDLAQSCYLRRKHAQAATMRKEKEEIYELKGQVLHYLVKHGILTGGEYHQLAGGNWAEVLTGNGYCFHRPALPPENPESGAIVIPTIEAKPKGRREPTLIASREAVHQFLADKLKVDVYMWPPRPQPTARYSSARDDDDEEEMILGL
jgi:hypothetical protein